MKLFKVAALALTTLISASLPALAEYPEKPVEFVVPWPPGGEEDILTRIIADTFQEMYGVPAAVINKPGGGGGPFPGAIGVATAAPDGYTVGSFVIGVPVVGPLLGIPELDPNPFEPVGIFMSYPFLIAAGKDAPYDTFEELAAFAKDNKVRLGHFGAPQIPTRVTFKMAEAFDFSFGGDTPFDNIDCNTLASGDVDVVTTVAGLVGPCLQDLKILATVTEERVNLTPDAPTAGELVPGLDITLWGGLFVPKGTPADVVAKIEAAAQAGLKTQKAIDYAKANGVPLYWKTAKEANGVIEADLEKFLSLGQ